MKSKKKGRPAGSKNREYVTVVSVPPGCPSCGGHNLTAVRGSSPRVLHHGGTLPTGEQYTQVRWENKECSCGQRIIVKSFIQTAKINNAKDIS